MKNMNAISQEQYETFKRHYQLIYKNIQISEYDISNRLEPEEFKHIRSYVSSGFWYSGNQRVNQVNEDDAYIVRKETKEIVKQVKTLWEVVDFVNNEMPCDLLEG